MNEMNNNELRIKGFIDKDIRSIYEEVKKWVEENHGRSGWFYEDYFADEDGYGCFKEEIDSDNNIKEGMTRDDVIDIIESTLGPNIFMSNAINALHTTI